MSNVRKYTQFYKTDEAEFVRQLCHLSRTPCTGQLAWAAINDLVVRQRYKDWAVLKPLHDVIKYRTEASHVFKAAMTTGADSDAVERHDHAIGVYTGWFEKLSKLPYAPVPVAAAAAAAPSKGFQALPVDDSNQAAGVVAPAPPIIRKAIAPKAEPFVELSIQLYGELRPTGMLIEMYYDEVLSALELYKGLSSVIDEVASAICAADLIGTTEYIAWLKADASWPDGPCAGAVRAGALPVTRAHMHAYLTCGSVTSTPERLTDTQLQLDTRSLWDTVSQVNAALKRTNKRTPVGTFLGTCLLGRMQAWKRQPKPNALTKLSLAVYFVTQLRKREPEGHCSQLQAVLTHLGTPPETARPTVAKLQSGYPANAFDMGAILNLIYDGIQTEGTLEDIRYIVKAPWYEPFVDHT